MSPHRHLALSTISAALLCASAAASAQQLSVSSREPMAAGLIVKFRDGRHSPLAAASAMQGHRASAEARGLAVDFEREGVLNTRVLRLQKHQPAHLLERLARDLQASDASIEYVEPDYVMHTLLTPNDGNYGFQWNMNSGTGGIAAPAAWDLSLGTNVRVAVLDTGVMAHADIAANLLPGYDFISSANSANDGGGRDGDASDAGNFRSANQCTDLAMRNSNWHGTHVAGIVAALGNNALEVTGVAPRAKIVPVRVLGACGGTTSDVAAGILWAVGASVSGVPANANPARILNLSLGGTNPCGSTYQAAINTARNLGALIVVAAGNDNVDASTAAPANCQGVLTVAATERAGGKASYSNWGAVVDLAAPGGDDMTPTDATPGILSLSNSGTSGPVADSNRFMTGTSMAAPHVAGVAALMMASNSLLVGDIIKDLMKTTTRSFAATCSSCGTGLLDAEQAVIAARGWRPEREPNDSLAQAQYLNVFPARVSGTLDAAYPNQVDIYSVNVQPGKSILARLAKLSMTIGYTMSVELLNASGTVLKTSTQVGNFQEAIHWNQSASTQVIYVRVKGKSMFSTGFGTQAYQLRLDR